MIRCDRLVFWSLMSLLVCPLVAAEQRALDPKHSHFGFAIHTHFGQQIVGEFPSFDGYIETLPDDKQMVHLRLSTADAVILDKPNLTRLLRGHDFFDSKVSPMITFDSEPFTNALLKTGGTIHGKLMMHATTQEESLQILPTTCHTPGIDCEVQSVGQISRSQYGITAFAMLLNDAVTFSWQGRLAEGKKSQ